MDAISPIHAVARTVFLQQVLPRKCGDRLDVGSAAAGVGGLGGLLPLGAAGDAAWAKEADAVDAL